MAASSSLSSRRGLGGFAALVGAALMVLSVFLPWFSSGDQSFTGWDSVNPSLADISSADEAVDTIAEAGNFFDVSYFDPASSFSPFFTGLSILIAGALLALISLAMLASLKGGAFPALAGRAALEERGGVAPPGLPQLFLADKVIVCGPAAE